MPYKNIIFVKLLWKELLLEDNRFTELCNDGQKGLYLMLLLLAGATNNNIPESENYLKRTLNLVEKPEIVAQNRDFLLSTFPKLIRSNGYLKFKKFKGLHNYLGKSKVGTIGNDLGRPRIDKNRIEENRIEENRIDKIKVKKDIYLDFVLLTKEELEKLVKRFGEPQIKDGIGRLNNYIGSTGKKYKSHYFTILNWLAKDEPVKKKDEGWKL